MQVNMAKSSKILAIGSVILVPIIIIFTAIAIWNYREPNGAEGKDLEYYKLIEVAAKTHQQVVLSHIFVFDWDRVYIQENPRMSEQELSAKLGFQCDLPPLEDWSGYPFRVLFLKENKVIYEFLYDKKYLELDPQEQMLDREDAVFTVSSKRPIALELSN